MASILSSGVIRLAVFYPHTRTRMLIEVKVNRNLRIYLGILDFLLV